MKGADTNGYIWRFNFVIMLCTVITLVLAIINAKK